MNEASRFQVYLVLGVGVLSMSFAAILIRLVQAPSLTVAAWRLTFAALALAPWALRRGIHLSPRDLGLCALGGLFLALHFALWIESLHHTTVASSVVLVTTNPIFVGLLSFIFGERPTRRLWLGIILSVGGAVLIGWGDFGTGSEVLLGDLMALGGAVMMSCYLLLTRRVRARVDLWPYVAVAYSVAALLLLAAAGATGAPLVDLRGIDWLWIVLLGLGPQVLGHTSMNWALRYLSPGAVAVTILGEPVGSALWAWVIFGERVGLWQALGCLIVLFGIAYTARTEGYGFETDPKPPRT